MASDKFIFYKEWWNAISGLPADIRGEVCESIIRYAFGETEAGLGSMATMALRFIAPQIDRDRVKYEAKCEQNKANASERKRTQANASERKRTGGKDNDKDNDKDNFSLSLSPSHEGESVESDNDNSGVTAAERERFFEILFFRNFKNPLKEVTRLIEHYSAVGWRKHGDIKPVNDKSALVRSWKPEKEQDIGRFPAEFIEPLRSIYPRIRDESEDDALRIIHGTMRVEVSDTDVRIICASHDVAHSYECHRALIQSITCGKRLIYSVPRGN